MKHILLSLASLLLAVNLTAGEGTWLTDLDKAKELAKTEKKHVLIDFTGSDWCPPCKALHKNVFSTPEFEKFAKDRFILVELDFPRTKPQSAEVKAANRELAKAFGITGYPTVVVLDPEGKEVSKKVGYGGQDAAKYIADLEKVVKK